MHSVVEFRSSLRRACRVQEYVSHRVHGSVVHYTVVAGFRNALHTESRVQDYIFHRQVYNQKLPPLNSPQLPSTQLFHNIPPLQCLNCFIT